MSSSPVAGVPSSPQRGHNVGSSSPVVLPTSSPLLRSDRSVGRVAASSPRSGTSHIPRTPSSRMGTPIRGDIGRSPARHYMQHAGEGKPSSELGRPGLSSSSADSGSHEVIWGTSVDVTSSMKRLHRFFSEFVEEETGEVLYMALIEELIQTNVYNLNVNCKHLYDFDQILYNELCRYPQELIPLMDLVVHEIIESQYPEDERVLRTQVRTFNLRDITNMRDLNPEDIDKLICVKGMIIRCSGILPDLRTAFFQCSACQGSVEVMIERGKIQQPTICTNCQTRNSMEMIHNRSVFADKQLIKLQETPDSVPEGETPHTVSVYAFDDLVDIGKPGDRVTLTGIFKARPVRVNSRKRTVRSVYHTYIDVVHLLKSDEGRLGGHDSAQGDITSDNQLLSVSEAKIEEIKALAREPNIYERLVKSLAPSIYEMDDVKKGVLCLLFGGSNKNIGSDGGRFRGELNVLLCGDPGTSKSQLLQYVHKIAPRGIYTSGKGSSAVGLTAYITKDPETRELVLESGALVLSDKGVCCIDEFDKMSEATRSILHEVMEQQTVSIAKAGIVCTLNARTSIVASANPVSSRYDPKKSVVDNINITPTLLSRFDLIYLILDHPNEMMDRKLASHLVSLYYSEDERKKVQGDTGDLIPVSMLTDYIAYAKATVQPQIIDSSVDALIEAYMDMRRLGQSQGAHRKIVTATPRQLESLIRLSESLARIRLSDQVEVRDVNEAKRLMAVATQSAATDPTTGLIDMDLIATGQSSAERREQDRQLDGLRTLFRDSPRQSMSVSEALRQFNLQSDIKLKMEDFRQLLYKLRDEKSIHFDERRIRFTFE